MRTIKVPQDRVGTLIGKNGETKKMLQDISGIKLDIDTEEGDVIIHDDVELEDPVMALKIMDVIRAVGRGFNPEKATRLFDDDEYLEIVDLKDFVGDREGAVHRVRGRLIGKDGKTRRIIEDLTGCDMIIYGNTVGLIGNSISLPVAKHAVELILHGSEHATVYHYLESQRPRLRIAEMGFDVRGFPMEQWIQDNYDKAKQLAAMGLCDHCLGRMFGKIGSGMTNDARGRIIRDALRENGDDLPAEDFCPLCENVFELMDRFAEAAAEAVNSVESNNFLVGSKVEPEIAAREKQIWADLGLESPESLNRELNREIGKAALPLINRPVEFKVPEVVALVDTRFADVTLDIAPLFIAGRYNKYSREIPQTIWPCRMCHGKGCDYCHGKGKMYETSVQEIIGDIALEMTGGEEHFFHGMGREDIDARMLGDGRPFVLEISRPVRRFIDLDELEERSSAGEMAAFNSLHFVKREAVERYKAAASDKVYRVHVLVDDKVNKEAVVRAAQSFKDADINQRTPRRVEHRRADLVRHRRIHWVKADSIGEDSFDLELETDSGTYVKEFVSGDEGRTEPSFSEALGVQCRVETLDVLAINYHEPRGIIHAEIQRNEDEDPQRPQEESQGTRPVADHQRPPDVRGGPEGQHHHRPQRPQGHAVLQVPREDRRRRRREGKRLRGQRQGRQQDQAGRRPPRAPRQEQRQLRCVDLTERYVSLAEVRDLLAAESERRELLTSQKAALDHAQTVSTIPLESAQKIIEEVSQIEDVTDAIAVKIADMLPQYPEDVRAIFQKERINLEPDKVDAIIAIVEKYI